MTYLTTLLLYLLSSAPQGDGWKPAKTDGNGDVIILEMEMMSECKNNKQYPTVITVDSDWSILIKYWMGEGEMYHIFDNKKNRIFSTPNFRTFISEVREIPDNTVIRDIGKCTTPYRLDYPGDKIQVLWKVIEEKNCELEEKAMFCYCCAKEMNYTF